jgi:subtilase family serine protease
MKLRSVLSSSRPALVATAAAIAVGWGSQAAAIAPTTALASTAPVRFTVGLPLRNAAEMKTTLTALNTKGSASYHKWLTKAQIATQFAPTAASMSTAEGAFTALGLTVKPTSAFSFSVSGTAAQVSKGLGVTLRGATTSTGHQRVVTLNRPVVPAAAAKVGAIIATLSPVPEHSVSSHKLAAAPTNRNGPGGDYNYNDMKEAYDYPSYDSMLPGNVRLDGTGVNVAVVMETDALDSDIAAMFNHEHFTTTTGLQPPTITHLPIDGGAPFDPNSGGSFEASLDVQQVLGGAPGASVTLLGTPDLSDQSTTDAYLYVVESDAYDIVTSSFGGPEALYLPDYNNGYDFTGALAFYDEIFAYGSLEGITFLASSGDDGALAVPDTSYFIGNPNARFAASVESPADDPYVTAVGGGNLITSYTPGSLVSTYVSENGYGDPEVPHDPYGFGTNVSGGYWGATGGLSQVFAQPPYQTFLNTGSTVARTIPDIGMQVGGCPRGLLQGSCPSNRSAAIVTLAGGRYGVIGTSVSSPEFAGALALAVEVYGRAGILNFTLYAAGAQQIAAGGASAPASSQFYHMNIPGYDGKYTATSGQGYNYIYGNGSPDVRNLFGLTSFDPAGTPRTISNP